MTTNKAPTRDPDRAEPAGGDLTDAIHRYVRTYAVLHGRPNTSACPATRSGAP